jgi:hypothetical protein
MARPGTQINIIDDAVPAGAILDTGQAFMVGVAARGPVGSYEEIASPRAFSDVFGDRSGNPALYDSVTAYFSEGGSKLYVTRVAAATAAKATIVVAAAKVTATATSPGTWGNALKVAFTTVGAGPSKQVVVTDGSTVVERSPAAGTIADAATWVNEHSDYIDLTLQSGATFPAAQMTLAGGTSPATVAGDVTTALATFDYGLGPGQVLAPGMTDDAAHLSLVAHANDKRRCAILDLPDNDDPTQLLSSLEAVRDAPGVRFTAAVAPWVSYPGPGGVTVTIPYSGVLAGEIARADAAGNPNQPAAGVNGISRLALGLSQSYTDDEREMLNEQGIIMAKLKYGDVRTYGYRTAAGPEDSNWTWFGNSRVVMAIAHECDAVAENYVLRQIDGKGLIFQMLKTDLIGVCMDHYDDGALYGDTADEAFAIDVGPSINTIDTIKDGEVHAVVRVKCSPAAEWVVIDIVKVPVERPIAA